MAITNPGLLPLDPQDGSADPSMLPGGAPPQSPFAGATWDNLHQFASNLAAGPIGTLAAGAIDPGGVGRWALGAMQPSQKQMQDAANARAQGDMPPVVPQQPMVQGPPNKPPGMMPTMGGPGFDTRGNDKLRRQGFADEQAGGEAAAKAQAAQQDQMAANAAQVAAERLQAAQEAQQRNDAAQAQAQADMQQSKANWEEFKNSKIDPNHFWNSRSGAQKASAALGLALSSFGSAITGQQPINLIKDAIDRDIDAQEKNAAKAKDYAQAQDNAFARNYALLKDANAARSATKAQYIDGLISQGDAAVAKSNSQVTQANWIKTRGALENQQASAEQDAYGKVLNNHLVRGEIAKTQAEINEINRRNPANGNGGVPLTPQMKEQIAQQEAAVANLTRGAKENADTLKELGTGDRIRHSLSHVTGGLISDSPLYGKLNSAQEAMAQNTNKANGIQTAQTEKQYQNMREGADTPTSPEKGVTFAKSQVAQARAALANTYAANYGIPLAQAEAMVAQKFNDPWAADNVRDLIRKKSGGK